MKRNKKLISGPGVQYFQYRSGIINKKRPFMVRIGMPVVMSLFMLGGAGFFGLQQFNQPQSVALSNQSQFETPVVQETERSDIDLEPFQAEEDKKLAEQIEDKIDAMPKGAEWAVSVRDLNSSRMANINADLQMESASFYKMFLLAPLEKRLSSEYWGSYLGSQPISECVLAMIEISDNECPVLLGKYMGWQNVNTVNQEMGFTSTIIGSESGNKTTSRDVSELMYRLQNSMMLSDKARRLVFDALYEQRYRDGIPTGCGQDCLVGNKTGNLDGIKHDAAIVKHGASNYVVVIMSQGSSDWSQVADLASEIDKIMNP